MRAVGIVVLGLSLGGCSTGVVQTDRDTYMISEKAAGCGFATAGGQEASAYKKANAFCAAKGQHVETVSTSGRDGMPFAHCASADLKFKCVP
jgi:hypothetical protein